MQELVYVSYASDPRLVCISHASRTQISPRRGPNIFQRPGPRRWCCVARAFRLFCLEHEHQRRRGALAHAHTHARRVDAVADEQRAHALAARVRQARRRPIRLLPPRTRAHRRRLHTRCAAACVRSRLCGSAAALIRVRAHEHRRRTQRGDRNKGKAAV
eukprot:4452775-Pleurochrysis_carterae.AAC.2